MTLRRYDLGRVLKINFIILLLLTTCGLASVHRVPSDYPTIQAGIDASIDGDTVFVEPGTYTGDGNRDIDFKGKAITVKSENRSQTCIIDCNGTEEELHRGFYFHNGEEANSVLQGFTIINGYARYEGGGIFCNASSPFIKNCIVAENTAHSGGGIACNSSNAVIVNCTIVGNRAEMDRGGGIFCLYGRPHILECLITENTAFESGGGIKCDYSDPTITRCIIRNNAADVGGGVEIGNRYGHDGLSLLTMTNCLITGNRAKWGGGMYCKGENTITNCFIIGNKAEGSGGGISCGGEIIILNCTISDNRTDYYFGGGGIQFRSAGKVSNSIIHGNITPREEGKEIYLGPYGAGGCRPDSIKITHSVVGSDPNAINIPFCVSGEWLYVDPLFAQPGYWDPNDTPDNPNDDIWVDGDYHLKSQAGRWDPVSKSWVIDDVTSPCIDTGDPNSPIGLEPFPNGGRINMGAYGGTAEASKSYFGEPLCQTIIAGDINGDCKVDFQDFALMAAHWLGDKR
jgi:predicted outer membrane repeat protein